MSIYPVDIFFAALRIPATGFRLEIFQDIEYNSFLSEVEHSPETRTSPGEENFPGDVNLHGKMGIIILYGDDLVKSIDVFRQK